MKRLVAVVLSLLAPLSGCLPTVEPQKHPVEQGATNVVPQAVPEASPPASLGEAAKDPNLLPPAKVSTTVDPAAGAKRTEMKVVVQDRAGSGPGNATIRVEKRPDGHFEVNGGDNLKATLTRAPEGGWVLDGSITFPVKGYTVGAPFATSLDDLKMGPGGTVMQKGNTQTMLTIPFTYPANVDKASGPESFPLHLKFDAPQNTEFAVFLLPGQ